MIFRRRKVMLVLGGGGVRGLAHLGVLKVLEEEGIPVDGIVGTSAGAIVGALYCRDPNAAQVTERVLGFLSGSAFRRLNLRFNVESRGNGRGARPSLLERLLHGLKRQLAMEQLFRRSSIFSADILNRLVGGLVGDGLLEELTLPLHVTALDLVSGEELVLDRGDLHQAVVASSSVPGFFPPVEVNGSLVCDAGLVNNMPVSVARALGAECVVAVSLNSEIDPLCQFPTGIDVIFRSEEIGTRLVNEARKREADVVIEPDMEGRYWLDFENPPSLIRQGELATRRVLGELKRAVGRRKLDGA